MGFNDFPIRMRNIEGIVDYQKFTIILVVAVSLIMTKESINRVFQNFFSDPFADPFGDMFGSFQPFGTVFTKPRITVLKLKPTLAVTDSADEDNDTL